MMQSQKAPLSDPTVYMNNLKVTAASSNNSPSSRGSEQHHSFDNGRGKCFVCQIDLTSEQHAKQHLSGQKHKKKVSAHEAAALFNRPPVSSLMSSSVTSVANDLPLLSHNHIAPSTQLSASLFTPPSQISSFQHQNSRCGPNGESYVMNESRGTCYVCNIELTSNEHAHSHLNGQKHKKKCAALSGKPVQQFSNEANSFEIANNPGHQGVLMCKLCQTPFSCMDNAKEHFMGAQHRKNVMLLEKQKANSASLLNLPCTTMQNDCTYQSVHSSNNSPFPCPPADVTGSFTSIQSSNSVQREDDQTMCKTLNSLQDLKLSSVQSKDEETRVKTMHSLSEPQRVGKSECSPDSGYNTPAPLSWKGFQPPPSHNTQSSPFIQPMPVRPMGNLLRQNSNRNNVDGSDIPTNNKISHQSGASSPSDDEVSEISYAYSCTSHNSNLEADVEDITKIKNKQFLDESILSSKPLPLVETASSSCQSISSIIDNSKQTLPPYSATNRTGVETSINDNSKQNLPPYSAINRTSVETSIKTAPWLPISTIPQHKSVPTEYQNGSVTPEDNGQSNTYLLNKSHDLFLNGTPQLSRDRQLQINEVSAQPVDSKHQPVYRFDGHQGYCNACSVELTSRQLADQHLYGQKHKKRAARWEYIQDTSSTRNADPIPVASSSPISKFEGGGNMVEQTEVDPGGPDITCMFNGVRGFCKACEIEITSLQHYEQHRFGRPHARARKRYLLSQQGVVYPLFCDVCKKPFTGQESAQQHFTSIRHKNKMDIVKDMAAGREVEKLENGRMVMRDSQVWFICDICDCGLNTREQFNIHTQSPRHKIKEEQMRSNDSSAVSNRQTRAFMFPLNDDRNSPAAETDETSPYVGYTGPSAVEVEKVLEENRQHLTFKAHTLINTPQGISEVSKEDIGQRFRKHETVPGTGLSQVVSSSSGAGDADGATHTPDCINEDSEIDTLSRIPILRYSTGVSAKPYKMSCHIGQSSGVASGGGPSATNAVNVTHGSPCDSTTDHISINSCEDGGANNSGLSGRPPLIRRSLNKSGGSPFRTISTLDQTGSDDESDDEDESRVSSSTDHSNFNISGHEEANEATKTENTAADSTQQAEVAERSCKPGFRYYCKVCNQHMNTKDALKAHQAGKRHQYYASITPAPERQLPLVVCNLSRDEIINRAIPMSKDAPRIYQLELLEKSMKSDTVIYLPTGTGKTLVAVLNMGLMLQENKTRPVLFLVDKVLLVLQQEKYIRKQFEGKMFLRPDPRNDDGSLIERELLVKVICGRHSNQSSVPIWKHDIIITTADFCINMLDQKLIRWKDFSLVILDEVHHCHKNHPYLRLFADNHHPLLQCHQQPLQSSHVTTSDETARQARWWPKVLGLSASPAGKQTMEETYIMLMKLLSNLGGAKVAMVMDERSLQDLDIYKSNAKVHPICVPLSNSEADFTLRLLEYFLQCYQKFANMCPSFKELNNPLYSYFAPAVYGTPEEMKKLAEHLVQDPEPLDEMFTNLLSVKCPSQLEQKPQKKKIFDHLHMHLTAILLAVSDIGSPSNIGTDHLLKELEGSERIEMFQDYDIPCKEMRDAVTHFVEHGSKDMTTFSKLLETLSNPAFIDWSDPACKGLVLVQRRQDVIALKRALKETDLVQKEGLKIKHLVGHGKNAQDGGMDVKKQKRVLDKQDSFRLLVATSIMEEGIDFQTLQLVVSVNPPTSIRALVQIRGRARRHRSHFVILCKAEEEQRKLEALLEQEKHMEEAARRCLGFQAS